MIDIKDVISIRDGSDYQRDDFDDFLKKVKFSFNIPAIHIAGTNGKGSTANYIASIYQSAGYKVGLFTSPVTCAALVIVGILMIAQLKDVEWDNIIVAASVFMTIIMMILTYSISLGIAWGFVVYAIASLASGKAKELGWGIWLMVIVFVIYLFFGL